MSGRHQKARTSLLEILTREENKNILAQLNERSFRKRHLLFMPYHKEDLIFIVKEGKLRVYLGVGRQGTLHGHPGPRRRLQHPHPGLCGGP